MKYSEFDVEEEYREDWDKFKMLDLVAKNDNPDEFRAYSMANHPAEGNIVMLNVRIAHHHHKNGMLLQGLLHLLYLI